MLQTHDFASWEVENPTTYPPTHEQRCCISVMRICLPTFGNPW
jgi:hypothetical protein